MKPNSSLVFIFSNFLSLFAHERGIPRNVLEDSVTIAVRWHRLAWRADGALENKLVTGAGSGARRARYLVRCSTGFEVRTKALVVLTARKSMMDARSTVAPADIHPPLIETHLLSPQLLVDPLKVLVVSGIADNQDWSLEEVEVDGAP